jgi:hypothetical protein
LCLAAGGCAYARGACAVIDVAHDVCEYYVVEYRDPATGEIVRQRVPRAALLRAAVDARASEPLP